MGIDAYTDERGSEPMGDKSNRAGGQIKEKAGEATGNRKLAESGRRDQVKGDLKSSGKKLKDAAKKL